jgi:hypothetical protein
MKALAIGFCVLCSAACAQEIPPGHNTIPTFNLDGRTWDTKPTPTPCPSFDGATVVIVGCSNTIGTSGTMSPSPVPSSHTPRCEDGWFLVTLHPSNMFMCARDFRVPLQVDKP